MSRGRSACREASMRALLALVALTLTATVVHGSRGSEDGAPLSARRSAKIERRWGIEIVALRRTAANMMIDMRYRVTDPGKAAPFVDRTVDAYLVDQVSGRIGGVPSTSKLGPMRQTLRFGEPPKGRVLFMLFANPGRTIQPGGRVTIVIGDLKLKNLVVQ